MKPWKKNLWCPSAGCLEMRSCSSSEELVGGQCMVGLWASGESLWHVHHRCTVGFGFSLSHLLRSWSTAELQKLFLPWKLFLWAFSGHISAPKSSSLYTPLTWLFRVLCLCPSLARQAPGCQGRTGVSALCICWAAAVTVSYPTNSSGSIKPDVLELPCTGPFHTLGGITRPFLL